MYVHVCTCRYDLTAVNPSWLHHLHQTYQSRLSVLQWVSSWYWKDWLLVELDFVGAEVRFCVREMMERSCSAECFLTDSVTSGYQMRSGRKLRNYPVHCVTAWHAAVVDLFFGPHRSHFAVCTCNIRVNCSTASLIKENPFIETIQKRLYF